MKNFALAGSDIRESAACSGKITFTVVELILYLALIFNLAFCLFYPVYSAMHDYFPYIIFAFTLLLLICGYKVKLSIQNIIKLTAFLILAVAVIWINHSGFGLLSTIAWPIVLIYMLKNSSLSDNYI